MTLDTDLRVLYIHTAMSATRTQVYLTERQRRLLDERCRLRGITLAEAVREAVDAYLGHEHAACAEALAETFGKLPDLEVPSRDEWDRG